VTSARRRGTPAAERKRQQRARDGAALLFEREDWRLFIDPATLPQKAGCQPENLRQIVLRELVDNALDEGAQVTFERAGRGWIVADNGPGLDPRDIPRLFAVNRPLLSRKRRRLPLR
jgi:signal transduction histidine kinase